MSSNELKDDDYICNSWEVPNGVSYISQSTLSTAFCIFLRPTKEEVNAFARVCLSVCLLARLLKNACMDLDEMLRVDRCWDMDELINF